MSPIDPLEPIPLPAGLRTRGLETHNDMVIHRADVDADEWLILLDGNGDGTIIRGGYQLHRVDDVAFHADETDRRNPNVRVVVFELDPNGKLIPERAARGGYEGFQCLLLGVYPITHVRLCSRGAILLPERRA